MRGSKPFADAGPSEVVARVAFRLIERDYRLNPSRYLNPSDGIRKLMNELHSLNCMLLSTALAAAALWLSSGRGKLFKWRDDIVHRSRYYAARRAAGDPWAIRAPRVTNRGGASPEDRDIIEAMPPRRSRRNTGRH